MPQIQAIRAREVLDSRGFPTIEVDLALESSPPIIARSIVPSGASTGEGEALELRDSNPNRFLGKGVLQAIQNIDQKIAPAIINRNFSSCAELDQMLIGLDGTPHKARLGANAILGISMAFVRALALQKGLPLWQFIAFLSGSAQICLPIPLINIFNGGQHADSGLDLQEIMIVPKGFHSFSDALQASVEIFHHLKKILKDQNLSTAVGDEGGFAPLMKGSSPHQQALQWVVQAISNAGYIPGQQVFLAIDSAASEFADTQNKYFFEGRVCSSSEMIARYQTWLDQFPICSIEDGLSEKDWQGWRHLTQTLGHRCQLVGDDLFVTHPELLKKGIQEKIANAILIKLNQIGTVTETLETIRIAQKAGYHCIISHRSGETEDTFIADFAVGTNAGQIKTGSVARSERTAKYNQLLRIQEYTENQARYGF